MNSRRAQRQKVYQWCPMQMLRASVVRRVSGTCTQVAEQSNIALVPRYTSRNIASHQWATLPCFISRDLGTVRRKSIERALQACRPRAANLMQERESSPEDADPSRAGLMTASGAGRIGSRPERLVLPSR